MEGAGGSLRDACRGGGLPTPNIHLDLAADAGFRSLTGGKSLLLTLARISAGARPVFRGGLTGGLGRARSWRKPPAGTQCLGVHPAPLKPVPMLGGPAGSGLHQDPVSPLLARP